MFLDHGGGGLASRDGRVGLRHRIDNRPTLSKGDPLDHLGWLVCDEIHQWFVALDATYGIHWEEAFAHWLHEGWDHCWTIEIPDRRIAALYKLTWL